MSAAVRSAPRDGYDFGAKRDYRRKVWGKLLKFDKGEGLIGLMPSIEGHEVEYLISKGVSPTRMVFIDRNPAIAATLSRRFKPYRSYGCDVRDSVRRMEKDGVKLSAFNLDLCGPVSPKLKAILAAVAETRLVSDMGSIAVTVMKGREHGRGWEFVRGLVGTRSCFCPNDSLVRSDGGPVDLDGSRVSAIFFLLTRHLAQVNGLFFHRYYQGLTTGYGQYPSGRLRMVWATIQLHRQPCLCDDCTLEWMLVNGAPLNGVRGPAYLRIWELRACALQAVFGSDAVNEAIRACDSTRDPRYEAMAEMRLRSLYA